MRLAHKAADSEVNAHLTERFGRASCRANTAIPDDNAPSSAPYRFNNDIREYIQIAKKPVTAGAWIEKAEIPSSVEMLPSREKAGFICIEPQPLIDIGEPPFPQG
jgi:helicase required for RNAi-mediated heterochromatin assembly 1